MVNNVFLIQNSFLDKLETALKKSGIENIKKGDKVAVKIHYGEYGNMNYIRPSIVEKVVEILKKQGAKPFLVETVMPAFSKSRSSKEKLLETARKHGFTEETMGCPILVSEKAVEKEMSYGKIKFSKEIFDADALVVVSHCKGHSEAGFGGAIKNMGMGSIVGADKLKVHQAAKVSISDECDNCKKCKDACQFGAISFGEKAIINYDLCFACGACVSACPKHAIKQPNNFRHLVSENADLVLGNFDKNKTFFINVLFDISPLCDCFPIEGIEAGFPICNDIGFLVSNNVFALDKASLDLIKKTAGKDVLFETNKIHPEELLEREESKYKLINI
jgi:uncharacterized Fe-S center protein